MPAEHLSPSPTPRPGGLYEVELCSGELRRWRFLGSDRFGAPRWRDEESGTEFSEASLMYAWRLVREAAQ